MGRRRIVRAGLAIASGLTLALGLSACESGAYPLDIFPEMHYQESYRVQEPPYATPPAGSVPTSGRDPLVDAAQIATLTSTQPFDAPTLERGTRIYRSNCAMCHGVAADGQSFVATKFVAVGARRAPPNLHSAVVKDSPDGVLFLIVTNGSGDMPSFQRLLTDDERWSVIQYLRSIQ
ncbi:MAG: cytochrome c [Actinobacteria bacterium]|nr:cytochrome c [Actinomycetota bacterium]